MELARQAEKMLDRLDRVTEKRIRDRLKELSPNPYDPRLTDDVIMEEGKKYTRVGNWRVVFRVEESDKLIFITAIQHRSKVYRK
ncbi:MAG: type II toxin-antitoxin system RelE/ParE family toxin [Deltaproteobacteria bacterium]|nr:type II toxin-antitoxin system RelE/ParE family toxin [Deltaproteobacteria bacterium]